MKVVEERIKEAEEEAEEEVEEEGKKEESRPLVITTATVGTISL